MISRELKTFWSVEIGVYKYVWQEVIDSGIFGDWHEGENGRQSGRTPFPGTGAGVKVANTPKAPMSYSAVEHSLGTDY